MKIKPNQQGATVPCCAAGIFALAAVSYKLQAGPKPTVGQGGITSQLERLGAGDGVFLGGQMYDSTRKTRLWPERAT